ncbi:RNA polymerase sigma factor [Sphingobacterium hotanense]|uniref:RNA polymerase sigma factor n=1 Tax=Sphingobacterium hotanense TaxID=649196 RepID=UPI0021A5CAAE|nr:RNA polymerase sigma-70 factor [Sphingobacterium hotanense]MCT1524500.1 RNA polymerase sigma-70 factor [Sphingobacterium hotanense]
MNLSYQERELLSAFKGGDDKAFVKIYERYWEGLFHHALTMTSCEDLAKDITQEIFVELWNKLREQEIQTSLQAYLHTTVRNKTLNLMAHGKVQARYLESLADYFEKGENRTDHPLRERQFQAYIDGQIASLPSKMRTIFEMSRNDSMTYKEIAQHLSLSDKTVKKQVSNALKILRVKLDVLLLVVALFKMIDISFFLPF